MTSSRRRAHSENNDDGAWGHVLNDAWRERLGEVDAALIHLGDPLRDPLKTVTGAEFVNALWQVPQHKRNRFLADLKVPAARRPSASIEESVGAAALARMSRWKHDRLNKAVAFMMHDALAESVQDFAHADVDAQSVLSLAEECLDELLATEIPRGLLVAGLVADLPYVASGATLAAWLRRNSLPGAEDTGEHIAAAEVMSSILVQLPWEIVTPITDVATPASVHMRPNEDIADAAGTHDERSASRLESVAAVDAAQHAYTNAINLTIEALEQLQQFRVPDLKGLVEGLERVMQTHTGAAIAAAKASHDAGLEAPADDADLATLIAALDAAAAATDPVRQTTRRLRAMELSGELSNCASPLQHICIEAENGDSLAIESTHGLVRLLDAKATGATLTQLSELHAQLRPLVPTDLAPLLLGIMLGQAHLTEPSELTAAEPMNAPPESTDADAEDEAVGDDTQNADSPSPARTSSEPELPVAISELGRSSDARPEAGGEHATESSPAEPLVKPTSVIPEDSTATTLATQTATVPADAASMAGSPTSFAPNSNADVRISPSGSEHISNSLRGRICDALGSHDTGLAYWLARAGSDAPLAAALRVAALAETLRDDVDSVAAAAVSFLEELNPNALGSDRLAALTALAAALRTTIVTGSPDAGAVLELLNVHVADHIGLSTVVQAVATAAQRGALAGGQLRALRKGSNVSAELGAAQQAAAAELGRSRRVLLARASDMADQLFAPHGAVGSLLTAVVADDRRVLDQVHGAASELGDPSKLKRLLDDLDQNLRRGGSSARPLQGRARQKLNEWITTALEPVHSWIRIARIQQRDVADRHLPGDLVALKDAASAMSAARTELIEIASASVYDHSSIVLLSAAVDTVDQLLSGRQPLSSCEGSSVDEIIGRALLRAPQIALDSKLRPLHSGDVTADALIAASRRSWPDVITARAEAGDFTTARHAIAVAATGNPALREQYTSDLETRLAAHRARSANRKDDLDEAIRRATRFGQLDDDAQIRLSAALEGADPRAREDLNAVDDELDRIGLELPALASAAADEITEQLQRLVQEQQVSVDEENRVRARIDAGDLASADEILAAIEAGQDLPDRVALDVLDSFFPAVPDALRSGLTNEVVSAVKAGTDIASCSFGHLPEETRTANAAALEAWQRAASADRHQIDLAGLTMPLGLAGIEAGGKQNLPAMIRDARSRDRRFIDLVGVRVVGNAIVPAFGSLLDGRLRLLLVWGPQTPRSIVNWVEQDSSDNPVLVCLFGTLSADARRHLAVSTAALPGKPVAVLDDAALTFLASRPEASITTTMQVLLPFATTNPYVPQAEGNVPTEMFYGRNHELVRLTGSDDCLVYGGRQLGKSALLRAAERRHIETARGIAVYVSTQRPDTLWHALRNSLENQGVRAPGRERRDPYAAVSLAVTSWLDANPGLRILVLIDECDDFFDLDARDRFTQTTRLRDLRNQTKQRFKPVFAGLHEVARFASLPNQPFAHLGKPLPIGPLPPAEAFRLVTQPLATLGFRFEDDLAAWRVLAYCNNQPILLQLVCQHLVNNIHAERDEFTPVPYVITDDELERVWGSPTLVAEVSGKLRLTLDLDPRYGVVARVLGLAAHEDKVLAMSTVTLREECGSWWPRGFDATADDEFRALLIEMVTLGVLVKEGTNWALRSANVRRTLGTSEDIAAWLLRADQATVPGPHVAGESRQQLSGARVAPLTEVQLADVTGQRNQLRIVFGSHATNADLIGDLLAEARKILGRFDLILPRGKGKFLDALSAGQRGGKQRVVYSDVTGVNPESVLEEIEEAHHRLPGDGVTRSAIMHVGIEQAEVWLELLGTGRGKLAADTVVTCRRLGHIGMERWSHEQHGQFSDPTDRDRLLEMTGGWPLLVDSVAAACAEGAGTSEALMDLRSNLDGELGKELLRATGLPGSVLEAGYAALVALGPELLTDEEELTFEQVLVDTGRPAAMLAALIAAGAVTRNDNGTLSLERVLSTLWRMHGT